MASSGIDSFNHVSLKSATSMLFEMRDMAISSIFGANDMVLDSSIEGTKCVRSIAALHTDGLIGI